MLINFPGNKKNRRISQHSFTFQLSLIGPAKKLPDSLLAPGFGANDITFESAAAILTDFVADKRNKYAAIL
jgi:hypothetical protein